jgi:hypothetical protein
MNLFRELTEIHNRLKDGKEDAFIRFPKTKSTTVSMVNDLKEDYITNSHFAAFHHE